MEEKQQDNIEQQQETNNLSFVRIMLDGSFLTKERVVRQIPFILLLFLFAIIYIGNRFHSERLVYRASTLQNQVKELRSESVSIAAELMDLCKQSQVALKVSNLDLKEATAPPKKIKLN